MRPNIASPGNESAEPIKLVAQDFLPELARLLLNNGIDYQTFSELMKRAFIDVASADHGSPERPAYASNVALVTGISRKEISRLRATPIPVAGGVEDKLQKLLSMWHTHPDYTGADGQPLPLPATGASESFQALVTQSYDGDIPPSTIQKELMRIGAVARDEAGLLRATRRDYRPPLRSPEALERAFGVMGDLLGTLQYNLDRSPDSASRPELRVEEPSVPAAVADEFRELVRTRFMELAVDLDRWLQAPERQSDAGDPRQRVGAGMYFLRDRADK